MSGAARRLHSRLGSATGIPPISTLVCCRFSPPATEVAGASLEEEVDSSSLIVQDRDLLRRSAKGLRILDLIDGGAVVPDLSTYSDLVRLCAHSKRLDEARLVHAHFLRSNFAPDLFFGNSIVNMFCKCGGMDDARRVFDAMPLRDMVTWTALITGYAQNDGPEKAIALFPKMLSAGLKPNQFTFASLLKAAGAFPENCGCDSSVYVGSSLLDMYARHGITEEARMVFESLPSKNEVSWNALIAGFARKGDPEGALESFREMQRVDLEASHYTYSSMFSACARIGSLEQGKWVHAHLVKSGCKLTAFLGNTLLDMYAKRDVVSWNSMLAGCAQHGLGREAVCRLEDMIRNGIRPNEITFLSVLTACSRSGLLNEGQHYFRLMEDYGITPQVEHYATMVDLLGRAGLLERAECLIREMPIAPTAAVWGLSLEPVECTGMWSWVSTPPKRAFELDPHDPGLICFSNVRKKMKEFGVKKDPACSWVEVENSVHVFVADDDSHPQREEIHRMWEEVNEKVKELGYVPNADHVLLFMDEQEREIKLQNHSERIALAFALLNTPPSAPIHIKKNIRVCGDCHSAFKLVSKAVNREIVVRDTNRFHHFSHGTCSCGDYW
ncbi:unnamed protein product [Spirodela intermedia]|uniref:DYW domain-containing protein n=1 Tax=Spirodela intermedia TaxID=51605 RepID=A0A7I8I9M3_SPIIN|nr:unnamed protein product [Spirodela intermedia]CAA6654406.1 unnamed protein product [Spirodela intermedia]